MNAQYADGRPIHIRYRKGFWMALAFLSIASLLAEVFWLAFPSHQDVFLAIFFMGALILAMAGVTMLYWTLTNGYIRSVGDAFEFLVSMKGHAWHRILFSEIAFVNFNPNRQSLIFILGNPDVHKRSIAILRSQTAAMRSIRGFRVPRDSVLPLYLMLASLKGKVRIEKLSEAEEYLKQKFGETFGINLSR